ncbi:MAG TPA: nitrilase-related carbon-nitrogen hydrolase [Chthonomonadaceae bacterium]|nr:nitrilase-related carbon-nitrogen hydrolase [Chthonomonadaceae bacterium]
MMDTSPQTTHEYGSNSGQGNLLGIQPYLTLQDYRSAETLSQKLETHLALARQKGWIGPETIVLFPELTGTYLLTAQEGREVYAPQPFWEAAYRIVQAHGMPLPADPARLPPEQQRQLAGLVRSKLMEFKAPLAAQIYQQVFSRLAQRYEVTLVAGSLFLPAPSIQGDQFVCDVAGPISNVCAVFQPNGQLYPELVKKVYPIQEEAEFLGIAGGALEDLPVFSTPKGKLGVAICADSWYPQTYQTLQQKGAQLLVSPSHRAATALVSGQVWPGYSEAPGVPVPEDMDGRDINLLTPYQAWVKYAMPERIKQTTIAYGMTVFAQGHYWQETLVGGRPGIVAHGEYLTQPDPPHAPEVISFWLN